jgi:hypothetical protein
MIFAELSKRWTNRGASISAGGQGRRELYLYDATDPLSVMWTKLNVERKQRNAICRAEAQRLLTEASSSSRDEDG